MQEAKTQWARARKRAVVCLALVAGGWSMLIARYWSGYLFEPYGSYLPMHSFLLRVCGSCHMVIARTWP